MVKTDGCLYDCRQLPRFGYAGAEHRMVKAKEGVLCFDKCSVGAQRLHDGTELFVDMLVLKDKPDVVPLREEDAYPAQPQEAYGWEKLIAERLCMHYREEYGLETRIVRFHNIFGPLGTWDGGREKAPAALCRKVALTKLTGNSWVEIWGDGEQTRSFCYIDDCITGIYKLMRSDYSEPVNLGQDRMVSINQLVDMIAELASVSVVKKHTPGPQGVRGRNSNNTRLQDVLNWEPEVSLEEGLARNYLWIEEQVRLKLESLKDVKTIGSALVG